MSASGLKRKIISMNIKGQCNSYKKEIKREKLECECDKYYTRLNSNRHLKSCLHSEVILLKCRQII